MSPNEPEEGGSHPFSSHHDRARKMVRTADPTRLGSADGPADRRPHYPSGETSGLGRGVGVAFTWLGIPGCRWEGTLHRHLEGTFHLPRSDIGDTRLAANVEAEFQLHLVHVGEGQIAKGRQGPSGKGAQGLFHLFQTPFGNSRLYPAAGVPLPALLGRDFRDLRLHVAFHIDQHLVVIFIQQGHQALHHVILSILI